MNFPATYAAARKALYTAKTHTKPLPAELVAKLQDFDPQGWADACRKVEAIRATIPALQAEYDALAEQACWRCHGTGQYNAPTNATRRGIPYCFTCNGVGTRRTKRT